MGLIFGWTIMLRVWENPDPDVMDCQDWVAAGLALIRMYEFRAPRLILAVDRWYLEVSLLYQLLSPL